MDYIQSYLDYFTANPGWAILIIFLIAFGEALLIIGLFVPSTVVLVGAGTLVGTGHLEFWPVFLATAIGAIAGDQVSYWAGRYFGDQLRDMWPLNRYPQLLARGEDYVREHGGKSIAIGRFVPGVKAVVPGIVGMFNMSQMFFVVVNVSSGIVWALAHVLPGVLLGGSLKFAGELSGRLAMVLLVLIGTLAVVGWLMRIALASLSPYVNALLQRLSDRFSDFNNRPMRRLGRALSPQNPRARVTLLFSVICLCGLLLIADMAAGSMLRNGMSNIDISVQNLLSELRSAPGDEIMVAISMLGSDLVTFVVGAGIVLWLIYRRAWRASAAAALALVAARVTTLLINLATERQRPNPLLVPDGVDQFGFPSTSVVMAAVAFGMAALLASQALGRWSKAIVTTTLGLLVVAIGFSNLYLDAQWTSDVLAGLIVGFVFVAGYAVVIEALPARRIRPLIFAALIGALTLGAAGVNFIRSYDVELARFEAKEKTTVFELTAWNANEWKVLPLKRIDLVTKSGESFVAQWIGDLAALEAIGKQQGWTVVAKWEWKDSFSYLKSGAALAELKPRPLLHEGLQAKLTAVTTVPGQTDGRLVLRAYKTKVMLHDKTSDMPVYAVSVMWETLDRKPWLYALPKPVLAKIEDVQRVVAALAGAPGAQLLAHHTDVSPPLAIIQAKQ
jgi:membrane protein DedA with SNARE-associated domain/membrane-associated phospholipid phosphatase